MSSGDLDRELDHAWAELTAPGAPFELQHIAVRGQLLRSYVRAPSTVRDVWLQTACFGENDYLVFNDERIKYAHAHRITGAVSAWLAREGVHQGDRVAIAMRNYPEWMLIYWACLSIGIVVVGMNAWWAPEEMAHAVRDSAPKVIFCDSERLERLRTVHPDDRMTIVAIRTEANTDLIAWNEVIGQRGDAPVTTIDPDDDACIFYTSGTTGASKGAQLTHRSCVANLMNMVFAAQVQALAISRALRIEINLGAAPRPVGLATTPLFHVTANNCLAYPITAAGGTLVLMHRWDAGEALRLIASERVTTMSGVPTMSRELMHHPDLANRDLSSLATLVGGGAQLPPDLVAAIGSYAFEARPSTGFGMTETSGIVTAHSAEFLLARPDSCGRAMPSFEVKLVDAQGQTIRDGGVGELYVRGSSLIKGYLNRPDATAEAIVDGWLHTGDIARIDSEGFIYIVDRKKDMILRGGENVYCAEVEMTLFRHPGVAEVCAFGVPDDRLGEEVAVAVVLQPGHAATADVLRSYAASLIARHKIPRYIWILREPLPRNAAGKFLRRELRASLKRKDAQ